MSYSTLLKVSLNGGRGARCGTPGCSRRARSVPAGIIGAVIDSLIDAILASRTEEVAALVERGAPVNGVGGYGSTPLYVAAVQGEVRVVRYLLEAGADPNKESAGETEGTPLCAAASWGHAEVVRLMLRYGADPNLVERAGEVPMAALAWARRNHHEEIVRMLLEHRGRP